MFIKEYKPLTFYCNYAYGMDKFFQNLGMNFYAFIM